MSGQSLRAFGGVFDTLKFLRDADGSVIAAALHSTGARGLRFDSVRGARTPSGGAGR